ncbi:hypothetical protein HDU79_008688 [Rhizoclosmatium sp. JEL0117]|nr:hypothetical protein HDU79_008688 [Rhizoclosmatium sp. JEL0117]
MSKTPPSHLPPKKLVLSHLGGPNSVVFADAVTDAAIYVVNINQSNVDAGNWFNQPTATLLTNPPTLPRFDEATPVLTTLSFQTQAVRNTLLPYKVEDANSNQIMVNNTDTVRFGFIMKLDNGVVIRNSFPIDEGTRFYALGFIPSPQFGKFHWVVDAVLHKSVKSQKVMSPEDDVVQFKLLGVKQGLLGASSATLATFTTSKSVEGLGGVFELYREWVSEEEAVLILSSVVPAFLAYKYRVQRQRHRQIDGTFYSNTGKDAKAPTGLMTLLGW